MKTLQYSKHDFTTNVFALAEEKGETSVDVDAAAGVSRGYFSRLRNAIKNNIPSVEVIAAVSNYLHVPMDTLVAVQTGGMTKEEDMMETFLEQLIADTREGRQAWHPMADQDLDAGDGSLVRRGEFALSTHCEEGYLEYYGIDGHFYTYGYSYYTHIDGEKKLYVIQTGSENDPEYDVFLIDSKRTPIGSTSAMKPGLAIRVRALYQEAALSMSHVHISDNCKNLMQQVFTK